jgi:4-hydroxy-2-oxoheptanedioate aldolase
MELKYRSEQPERSVREGNAIPTLIERHRQRLLAHLRRKVSLGVHLSFLNADLVEACGNLGFHWLFLDGERTPVTPSNCRDLVRAADLTGMFCMARVTSVNPTEIEGYLDAGVVGILAPNISSADEAEALVSAVKFPVRGHRRAASHSRAAGFGLSDQTDPLTLAANGGHARGFLVANAATFTGALIESREGIEHLDEILAVPGLDYIALGPNDLALSLASDNSEHPRVKSVLDAARRRLQAAGRPQIAVVAENRCASDAVAHGATLVAIPDATLFNSAGFRFLDSLTL